MYMLDTNTISDIMRNHPVVSANAASMVEQDIQLGLCIPVYYELVRGFLKIGATTKLRVLRQEIVPWMTWVELTNADWLRAARFWSETTSKGRQLSDVDLLLAAISYRLGATLASSDDDFLIPQDFHDFRLILRCLYVVWIAFLKWADLRFCAVYCAHFLDRVRSRTKIYTD